jgi:hypothetical protein
MCLVGAAAEPGGRMGSAEWVGVGGRDCLGWDIAPKPRSGSAGKQANGVSKALLWRVNHERGEMAYRACGLWRDGRRENAIFSLGPHRILGRQRASWGAHRSVLDLRTYISFCFIASSFGRRSAYSHSSRCRNQAPRPRPLLYLFAFAVLLVVLM